MKKLILVTLLLLSPTVFSAPLLEDQYKVGEARLKFSFFKIYDSILFSADKRYESIEQEMTLSIDYLRNIPKKRIINAAVNQWEHLNFDTESIVKWSNEIESILPEIRKNDNLSFYKDQYGFGEFYYNDKLIGKIDDKNFSEAFLSIWLSSDTSQPKLRKKLIGNNI